MSRQPSPGLYIHVPFCDRVCPYCDFAVQTGGPKKRLAFMRSLLLELRAQAAASSKIAVPSAAAGSSGAGVSADAAVSTYAAVSNAAAVSTDAAVSNAAAMTSDAFSTPFDTIYLGGGTPSSLSPETLGSILETVHEVLPVAAATAVTLEANPEDVRAESLAAWRGLGVNRLSMGVQSFDAAALQVLGRSHTSEQGREAVERALAAGFEAVSLDLIFAVPGPSEEGWRRSLRLAVELQPHHISCYELTVHPRTRFYGARERGAFAEVGDDEKADLFFSTHRFLGEAGYPAYEVSNFAREPEFRSRHNAKYWDHTPYLGLGPSAHSFDGTSRRWWNERRLVDWQAALDEKGDAVCGEENLSSEQLVLEVLGLGLRTAAGVDLDAVERRYGVDLMSGNAALIESLAGRGLLRPDAGTVLLPTLEGMAVADTLATAFEIPAGPPSRDRS